MLTYQMVGVADQNNKTYECKYGTYNSKDGFVFNNATVPIIHEIGWRGFVNKLFHENIWKLKAEPVREMSIKDIEKELGYRIKIKYDDKPQEEMDEIMKLLHNRF